MSINYSSDDVVDVTSKGAVRNLLIKARKGKCENCGHKNIRILEVHHIVKRSNGGKDNLANLKLLCRNCHGEIHLGKEEYKEKHTTTWWNN